MADLQTSVAVTDAALVTTDVTTNDASTTKHGFLKKLDNTATNFMNGAGNWAAPAAGGQKVAWVGPSNSGTNNITFTANDIYLFPFTLQVSQDISAVLLDVSVQNGNVAVGVYNSAGTRVATSGSVGCPAAGNGQSVALTGAPVSLAAGQYYLVCQVDGTTAALKGVSDSATSHTRIVNTTFPLPASITVGSTAAGQTARISAALA